MKLSQNIYVIVGGAVFVVALGASGFLLYRGFSQLAESETTLSQKRSELTQFFDKNPFPSPENVARERDNMQRLGDLFSGLTDELQKGQGKAPEKSSPSTFMSVLNGKRNGLVAAARARNVNLAQDMGFGFDKYLGSQSELPAPDHVPRLTQQLAIVETLGQILFKEGISELTTVKRDEFEGAVALAAVPAAPQGGSAPPKPRRQQPGLPVAPGQAGAIRAAKAGVMGAQDLYSSFRFTLEFKAKERALTALLNRIAAANTFMIVRRLQISKETPDVQDVTAQAAKAANDEDPGQNAAAKPATPPRTLTRQERMVSGLGMEAPMKVLLELDVYRFRESE
jgi:hypothetical protein